MRLSYLGPVSCVFHILSSSVLSLGSGCSLMAAMLQVFSFLISLGAQELTLGGLESLMTVTSLFTDIAGLSSGSGLTTRLLRSLEGARWCEP